MDPHLALTMAERMAQLMVPHWAEHLVVNSARLKAEHLARPTAEHWAAKMVGHSVVRLGWTLVPDWAFHSVHR